MAKVDIEILNDPQRNIELVDPIWTALFLIIGSGAFVAAGILIIQSSDGMVLFLGYLITGLFSLTFAVGVKKLFGDVDKLSLDRFGLTYALLGKDTRIEWDQIDSFGVVKVGPLLRRRKFTSLNYKPSARPKKYDLSQQLFGFDRTLPANYGVKPEILAVALQKRLEANRKDYVARR